MQKRWMRGGVVAAAGLLAAAGAAAETAVRETKVRFIRQDTPAFSVPAYRGERYSELVPDTLDIQERINLAVNGLTGPTDAEKDYLIYFRTVLMAKPPKLQHDDSDICQMKFMEALPLMRVASGSDWNAQVDPVWMRTALRMIGPDGLAYWPSLPWAPNADVWNPHAIGADHYAMPLFCGRLLGAMSVYLLRDPSGPWKDEARKVVDGLRGVAIEQGDYAYFPYGGFAPGRPRVRTAEMPLGIASSLAGWTTQGLSQYYRASGYEPARELAGRLARYIAYHGKYYGPDGEFLPNNSGYEDRLEEMRAQGIPVTSSLVHFQHHTVPLLGILDYALVANDRELAEFVRRSFDWARRQGNDLVGYFPENLNNPNELETAETCQLAGMIGLALKLSQAGLGDYWDNADRWIRNQFAENQLQQADWMYHMIEGTLTTNKIRIAPSAVDPVVESADRVPERVVGGFAGWPTANDWFVGHGTGMQQCCTGNGTRALYYIWEHILTRTDAGLRVNLLLNRPSPWADVLSHVPYNGRVEVKLKQDCPRLEVRIPSWTRPAEVACTVNGQPRTLAWNGRYAVVGAVAARDQVAVTFPIVERKVGVDIQRQHYYLTIKGHDVVDIYPRGRFAPYYQRNHYRRDDTRWRMMPRFVSAESIVW
ncbi:MAG: glycoside hydrolase family 127 protein [Opitutaceae bacterium]|nr:glycoside hydrolase family 127 protein [Opitutaceae bacterium]